MPPVAAVHASCLGEGERAAARASERGNWTGGWLNTSWLLSNSALQHNHATRSVYQAPRIQHLKRREF
jgi:hypothetical protein